MLFLQLLDMVETGLGLLELPSEVGKLLLLWLVFVLLGLDDLFEAVALALNPLEGGELVAVVDSLLLKDAELRLEIVHLLVGGGVVAVGRRRCHRSGTRGDRCRSGTRGSGSGWSGGRNCRFSRGRNGFVRELGRARRAGKADGGCGGPRGRARRT